MLITKLLGKLGLPFLINLVKDSLSNMDNDLAKQAGSALGEVNTAIKTQEISLQEVKEANRHIEKIKELQGEYDTTTLTLINTTIQKELLSEDRFVRFWRPFFGYTVSIAWLAMMLTICYCVVSNGEHAANIIMALVETASLWGVALGVLGISVVKSSQEKTPHQKQGLVSKVIDKMT